MTKDELFDLMNDDTWDESFYDIPEDQRPSKRKDLCAFILLDKLAPDIGRMVSAVAHDVIYLDIDIDKLAEVITIEQVHYLMTCSVNYERESDSLYMYV